MKLRFVFASLISATFLVGCAVADGDVDGIAPKGRVDGGGFEEEDEDTGSSSTTDTGSSSTLDTGSSSTLDTGSSSTEDTGSSPGGDTSSGTPCSTVSSSDCMSSYESMTAVSGDTGGTATTTGTDSKFLRIRVSEDDSALFSSKDLKARVTLTSTGANFDLYVYRGATAGDGGAIECTAVTSSSTEALGTPDVVALTWTDNRPIGGHDDTRYLSIEVRAAGSSCAGASWTLKVEGNK